MPVRMLDMEALPGHAPGLDEDHVSWGNVKRTDPPTVFRTRLRAAREGSPRRGHLRETYVTNTREQTQVFTDVICCHQVGRL